MLESYVALASSYAVSLIYDLGYIGIIVLMFLESSFIPFPSEIVMIPAGYLAQQGKMKFLLVILFGIIGSVLGALFNYYVGYKLGRPFLYKWGRYMLIDNKKLAWLEEKFNIHGEIITFIGRLIPGIRQYISFPPGIASMNKKKFIIYTAFGASIWITILSSLGYFIGENIEVVNAYLKEITYGLLVFVVIILAIYWWIRLKVFKNSLLN